MKRVFAVLVIRTEIVPLLVATIEAGILPMTPTASWPAGNGVAPDELPVPGFPVPGFPKLQRAGHPTQLGLAFVAYRRKPVNVPSVPGFLRISPAAPTAPWSPT